jgi:Fe2+ or Zn2+ uptake regulation protein
MTARDERSVAEREDALQGAVLGLLVFAHPGQFSVEELVREMTDRPDEFSERDAIDNALRDLAGAGLVHRHGRFVFATRAAVRCDELRI